MPEVDKFGDLLLIGQNPDSFVATAERALAWNDSPQQVKVRTKAVAAFSWEHI